MENNGGENSKRFIAWFCIMYFERCIVDSEIMYCSHKVINATQDRDIVVKFGPFSFYFLLDSIVGSLVY